MKILLTIMALISIGFFANAQTKTAMAIDARLNRELNGPKADAGAHDIACTVRAIKDYDKEIDRVYLKLKKGLPPAEREALIASQIAWEKFMAAEIKSLGLISIRDGTYHQFVAAQSRLQLSKNRLEELCDRFENDPSQTEFTETLPDPPGKE